MEKFYFFDSNTSIGDRRLYSSSDWSKVLSKFLENGIYKEGDNLAITADGAGMTVTVGTGLAFIDGHMYENDEDLTLNVDAAEATLDRIDLVVLRLDLTEQNRYIKSFVVKGTAAASPLAPSLTNTTFIKEIALAEIRVTKAKSTIEQSQLTDKRSADFVDPFTDGSRIDTLINRVNGIRMPDEANFNHMLESGPYIVRSTVNAPPKSVNNPLSWWYVQVVKHDDKWILQIAYDLHDGIYTRRAINDGTFTGWKRIGDERRVVVHTSQFGLNQPIPSNTWTRVQFTNVMMDEGGLYRTGDTFVIPESGYYRIHLQTLAYLDPHVTLELQWWEVFGGVRKDAIFTSVSPPGGLGYHPATGETVVWFNKDVTIEFVMRQNSANSRQMGNVMLVFERL